MSGLNKAMIIGYLGQDPEIKYLSGGDAVCNFSVATSESWKDKNTGEKVEKTEWHRVVAFRQLGELCVKFLSKGRQCFVEGKIQTRSYEKDGITRYSTEIVASAVQFLGGGSGSAGEGATGSAPRQQAQAPREQRKERTQYQEPPNANDLYDDDVPF